jgi:hypothetical protein
MNRLWTAIAGVSSAAMLLSAANPAAAYDHRHHYHHYRAAYRGYDSRDCWSEHRDSANTGTVLGAIGGGIIGSQLAGRGSRGVGTALGAGGGAVIGHQIGAHSHRCR